MRDKISTRLIMDRMNDNPNMKSLKQSSVASYVRDFASINSIVPMLGIKYAYRKTADYKASLPDNLLELRKVHVCPDTILDPALFEDNTLNASYDNSIVKNKYALGSYKVENRVLFLDVEVLQVELEYKALVLDELGFPIFPYDGSLMQAIEWYVKWRYYTILSEINMIQQGFVDKAEKQYEWYIGQYVSKEDMLSFDEAVTVANSWQRLLDTRSRNTPGTQFREFNSM